MWGTLQQLSKPFNVSLSNKRISYGQSQHGGTLGCPVVDSGTLVDFCPCDCIVRQIPPCFAEFNLRRKCDQFRVPSGGVGESETDSRTKAVAKTLLQKEEELKFITAPGRLPPRASVVGSLRKEIAQLRLELADPENYKFSAPLVSSPARLQPSGIEPASKATEQKASRQLSIKSIGSSSKKGSSAKAALLMVEKQLSLGDEKPMVPPRQVSDKVRDALVMVEKNMTIGEASVKNSLTDLETLQVENAVLRTRLEVTLEKKRQVMQLHSAWMRRQELEREQMRMASNGSMNNKSKSSKNQVPSGSDSDENGKPTVASFEKVVAL